MRAQLTATCRIGCAPDKPNPEVEIKEDTTVNGTNVQAGGKLRRLARVLAAATITTLLTYYGVGYRQQKTDASYLLYPDTPDAREAAERIAAEPLRTALVPVPIPIEAWDSSMNAIDAETKTGKAPWTIGGPFSGGWRLLACAPPDRLSLLSSPSVNGKSPALDFLASSKLIYAGQYPCNFQPAHPFMRHVSDAGLRERVEANLRERVAASVNSLAENNMTHWTTIVCIASLLAGWWFVCFVLAGNRRRDAMPRRERKSLAP